MPRLVDHDQRRDEVANLAQRVICDRGLANLTLRDVASLGGWSPTGITHYFRNREELLVYTLQHSRDQVDARITAALESGTDALTAIIEQTLPLDEERATQWQVWLAFWGSAVGNDALSGVQERSQRLFRSALAAALQSRGTHDPDTESGRLVALIDGVSIQAVFAPQQWPPHRQLAQFADYLT